MNPLSLRALMPAMAATLILAGAPHTGQATEIIYYPVNPSFGGSPLNGAVLLNSAQAQNKHKDPEADIGGTGFGQQSALQSFNDSLERAILSRLSAAASAQITGTDGSLRPGSVQTGNFVIDIVDLGTGALQITTTDKLLGTSTSFQVGK